MSDKLFDGVFEGVCAIALIEGSWQDHANQLAAAIKELSEDPNHDSFLLGVLCDSARVLCEQTKMIKKFQKGVFHNG